MNQRILLLTLSLMLSLLGNYASGGRVSPSVRDNEDLLIRLDSLLLNNQSLVQQKEIRIDGLRQTLNRTPRNADRLPITRQLYDEFLVYDSDSAQYYATESRKIAERFMSQDYNLISQWKLNEVFIMTVQGLYDKSLEILGSIDTSRLDPSTKLNFFNAMAYVHSMRSVYVQSNPQLWQEELRKSNAYRDSLKDNASPTDKEWLWVPVAIELDRPDKNVGKLNVTYLKEVVDSEDTPSRENAINAYWLSRYYEEKGDMSQMVKYKTLAAIYDASIVNREIAALQELATYLFDQDELHRAYSYLIYAANQANSYHNRYRMVSISDVMPSVRDRYNDELHRRDRRLSLMVWLLGVVSIVLIGCIIFIVIEFRKIKKVKNLLKKSNSELNVSIGERDRAISRLKDVNREQKLLNHKLKEANAQKIGLLAYSFKLTSEYINSLDDYRKTLLKKYKVKNYTDMGVLINNPDFIKEYYQKFYESFDKMILSLFPTFVEDYNLTASAENQVSAEAISKSKTLNTRLRIYALRRLGVEKSSEIASMLNVSIRTIYNNRNNGSPEA